MMYTLRIPLRELDVRPGGTIAAGLHYWDDYDHGPSFWWPAGVSYDRPNSYGELVVGSKPLIGNVPTSVVAQGTLDVSAAPTWTTNDTWTFREGTTTATYTVQGLNGDGYAVVRKTSSGETDTLHFGKDLVSPSTSGTWRLQWPLTQGVSWVYSYSARPVGSVEQRDYTNTFTVANVESVTVPAGTFQAVRIHGKQCITSSARRLCGDFDTWFAPQVNWFVKRMYIGMFWSNFPQLQELISYELH